MYAWPFQLFIAESNILLWDNQWIAIKQCISRCVDISITRQSVNWENFPSQDYNYIPAKKEMLKFFGVTFGWYSSIMISFPLTDHLDLDRDVIDAHQLQSNDGFPTTLSKLKRDLCTNGSRNHSIIWLFNVLSFNLPNRYLIGFLNLLVSKLSWIK